MPVATNRKKIRISIAPSLNLRDSNSHVLYGKDANYDNCVLELRDNPITKDQVVYLNKRQGVGIRYNHTALGTGNIQWMGVFHGIALFISDNKLYSTAGTATLRYTFNQDQVYVASGGVDVSAQFGTDFTNAFAYRATEIYDNGVEALYITNGFEDVYVTKAGTAYQSPYSFQRFVASGYYKPGDKVIPSTYALRSGYYYIVTGTAGTVYTAAAEPAWPTTLGDTVTSGGVTFMCFDTATSSTVAEQYTNRAYALNALVQPATETGLWYKVTTAGTTLAEPTWTQIKGDTCTNNGVVFECMGYYGGKPGLAIISPVYLDTYLVLAPFASSDLYHSDPSDPYSWKSINFISADSFTSPLSAIIRYNNYIVAFSESDAELFYNNANETGSVFSRHESFLLQVGCAGQSCVMMAETVLFWLGKSKAGDKTLWVMDGFEPKEVGTVWVNKYLNAVSSNIPQGKEVFMYPIRIQGQLLFVMTISSRTLVYNVALGMWNTWSSYLGGAFPFEFYAFNPEATTTHKQLFMSRDKKELFYSAEGLAVDDWDSSTLNNSFPVTITTNLIDMDNRNRKFLHSIDLIGDLPDVSLNPPEASAAENSTIKVYWSDDDYKSIANSTAQMVEISLKTRPRIPMMGSFRRRAFKFVYQGNMPMRLEAIELTYTQGSN